MSHKKKFGKNLNKLVQASAAPPIVKTDKASQNGLLLLSTKKSGGSSLLSKTTNGSSVSGTTNNNSSTKSLETSTHDVLMNAIKGSSAAVKQHDAWGVVQSSNDGPGKEPMENEHYGKEKQPEESFGGSDGHAKHRDRDDHNQDYQQHDSYNNGGASDDEQTAHMRRLAHERAEKRRLEEQERFEMQQSRATDQLRDLNPATTNIKPHRTLWEPSDGTSTSNSRPNHNNRARYHNPKSAAVSPGRSPRQQRAGTDSEEYSENEEEADSDDSPVITLKSYDDRNRGEQRTAGAAPRMLFDPKSGSMVAVKPNSGGDSAVKSEKKKKKKKARKELLQKQRKQKKELMAISKANPNRKFPRTCGVLYTKDSKGNIVSVDGCDGDDGNGAHTSPGGRVNNSEMANDNMNHVNGHGAEVEEKPEPVWITADDNLELVGDDGMSPQLKVTAKVFAPSEAAMAAIQAKGVTGTSSDSMPETDDDDEDDEDDVMGLGFDPTQNVDNFVMPSRRDEKRTTSRLVEVGVGLDGLDLDDGDDQDVLNTGSEKKPSSSLFGFGTHSSTWGNSGTEASGISNDWSSGLFSKPVVDGSVPGATATASFLNIPPNNAWASSPSTPETTPAPTD